MTDTTTNPDAMESFFEQLSNTYTEALERNVEAQAAFADSWMESMEDAFSEERFENVSDDAVRAYESWMDAAEASFERIGDALEGEDVDLEEFRDIWLNAANKAFKETMSSTAFAAATGQNVEDVLDFQRQLNEAAEETLHGMGFATTGDVREVGERLVELERCQHGIDQAVDRLSEDVEARFDAVEQGHESIERGQDEIEATLDGVDDRLGQLDEKLDEVDTSDRLDEIERSQDDLDDRFDQVDDGFDRIDDRFERLDERLDERDVRDRLDEIEVRQQSIDEKLDQLLEQE